MSYEYNDTTPAVAPVPPTDAAVPTNGAAPASDTIAATAVAPKPGSIAAAVQRGLAARGYYNGQINGIVGKSTRAAISDFQADKEIPATGSITQSLLQALGL
jgi:peptidoglycan hydrolase-like protein with peptidoglycan-binding domain